MKTQTPKYHYGLKSAAHAIELAKYVCNVLGGGDDAVCLLLETCAAETQTGTYPDATPKTSGVGCCQFDQIGLDDVQLEGEQRHFELVKNTWGYDIPSVKLADLAEDPLLSFILCRLKYKRIPAAIPHWIAQRATYWKTHYNSSLGKGSVEHYVDAAKTQVNLFMTEGV